METVTVGGSKRHTTDNVFFCKASTDVFEHNEEKASSSRQKIRRAETSNQVDEVDRSIVVKHEAITTVSVSKNEVISNIVDGENEVVDTLPPTKNTAGTQKSMALRKRSIKVI